MTEQVIITRRAPQGAVTWNAETRSVEVVFSTGADVERYDARGLYIERLSLDQAWPERIPVLDAHDRSSMDAVLGHADQLRTVGGEARAVIHLSRHNPKADRLAKELDDGAVFGVSVGYRITEIREAMEGQARVKIASKWTPVELSFVPIAADAAASTRSGENIMPNDNPAPVNDRAAVNTAIRSIAEIAGLDRDWADQQIDRNATADEARTAAFEEMQRRGERTRTITATAHNDRTLDNPEVRVRAMGEALFARIDSGHQPSDAARQFAYLSVPDMARECIRAAGMSVTGLSASQIVVRALHSTSDFPLILGDAVGRTMRQAYEAAPSGLKAVARMTTMRDFRERKRIQTSQFSALEKVNEQGEFKRGTIREEAESYKLATFGKVFGISRQALVNDDMGALSDIPRKLGQAAAAFEAQALVDLLVQGSGLGPAMGDSKRLFHADHGNLASGGGNVGAPSETLLSKARLAMRKQTDASGQLIAVVPKIIVIPSDLETTTEKLLAAINATTVADANVWSGKLTPVVEPRLASATAWYVVDPAIDGLEYAHLEGEPGPQVETRAGFDVDGIETRVRLDFGCGFTDWRGWYRNPGQ